MKIIVPAYKLISADGPSRVWVANLIDSLAGFKTKLLKVNFDITTNNYIFTVKRYKPVTAKSLRKKNL